jgi:hypothetical protein
LILGKEVIRSTQCDKNVIKDMVDLSKKYMSEINVDIVCGKTLCANDFYEGI